MMLPFLENFHLVVLGMETARMINAHVSKGLVEIIVSLRCVRIIVVMTTS